ncbi:hypothetical protein GQ600_25462 [Phytophthora cactorum]|nr:hypothetical protein GQ600_25462 [Phytophthora cactorum]
MAKKPYQTTDQKERMWGVSLGAVEKLKILLSRKLSGTLLIHKLPDPPKANTLRSTHQLN